ncbi:MAG TPA: tripartite tricarboxylate transporter substrate-binding protein [Falsiroseomonas sp.]|jgi:tripartite-type tricarboxylate transporter receptor subunit TctC|nr:tripartite tricarboxylate transporter substrate-binding protein [Falsiroseomonas sp.]
MRRRDIGMLAAAMAGFGAAPARAQAWPTKAVRVIVPYSAGGATDIVARIVTEAAGREAGQSFVVENRGGGASIPGTQAVATAPPDGYTLGFIDTALVINPGLFGARLPYDAMRDLAPVGLVATSPLVFLAHPDVPARSLAEATARIRDRAGQSNIGHAGNGTAIHLASAQLLLAADAQAALVAYRGGGPMLTAALAHEVDYVFSSIPACKPHIEAGRLRALAVTGARRSAVLPDVPTFAESGLPAVDAQPFFGVVAPAGTPAEVLERANALLVRQASTPAIAARLAGIGYEVAATDRARFAAIIQADTAKWTEVIRRSNITVD